LALQINHINMKKKIALKGKLELNKFTVVELNNMNKIVGGVKDGPYTPEPTKNCGPPNGDDQI
jgi:hypothetical protein